MHSPERSHFSVLQHDVAERLSFLSTVWPANKAVDWFQGADKTPAHSRIKWRSNLRTDIPQNRVEVDGNPEAGYLIRNWSTALVMVGSEVELEELRGELGPDARDALAYIADDVPRVGVRYDGDRLFAVNEALQNVYGAMRIGRGPLVATMGIWSPDQDRFVGLRNIVADKTAAPVSTLHEMYPGIRI